MNTAFKVLLVDDDPDDAEVCRRAILSIPNHTFEVTRASTGLEAIQLAAAMRPNFVWLDYGMPDEDGLDILRQLKADQPDLPIAMISGLANEAVAAEAKRLGAVGFVVKSEFEYDSIRRRVVAAMMPILEPDKADAEPPAEERVCHVLIIDDSLEDCESYTRALSRIRAGSLSYRFTQCHDGAEGLRLMREVEPDCVLLDYGLPGSDGLKVLTQMRQMGFATPIIILTGQGSETVAVEAMRKGAQDYIVKTQISGDFLHRIIGNACTRQALVERVQKQQDALRLFTRALAHDLKEPLRTIRCFTQLAVDSGSLHGDPLDYLNTAISAAENMERLVDTVRAFTSLEASSDPESRELRDLADLARQAMGNLQHLCRQKSVVFNCELLPSLRVNAAQITSVFQNLFANAIRYSDKDTVQLDVRARDENGFCVISVADNGPGLAADERERVFEPFHRSVKDGGRGAGLGLAICRKVIEAHGGRIGVASKPGEGARFEFTLPLALGETADRSAPAREQSPATSNSRRLARVLLVDDNEHDVFLTRIFLNKEDRFSFDMSVAENGKEALMYLENPDSPKIDLVLLDINMPVMDGFSLLRELQARGQETFPPVVMCSTSNDPRDTQLARSLGAVDYVVKPLRLEKLIGPVMGIPSLEISLEGEGEVSLLAVDR